MLSSCVTDDEGEGGRCLFGRWLVGTMIEEEEEEEKKGRQTERRLRRIHLAYQLGSEHEGGEQTNGLLA